MTDELMFIRKSTMDAIAEATREASGTTAKLYPEQMPAQIRATKTTQSNVSGIPSGIVAEAERVVSSIQTKMASNSLNFIAISDMHEMGDSDNANATIIERYRRANRNAGQGARLIAEKINPDFFVNLGDLAWGSSSTTLHDLMQSVCTAKGYTAAVDPLTESFYTPGNHDVDCGGQYLDENIVTGLIGSYRYVDLAAKKVRVICLNTADTTDGTDGDKRISGEQLQWFANALDLSGKSDAAKWGIIVLSHHPIDWNVDTSNIIPAANCLAAYLNGTAYSATHDGITVSYDYTGKNMATFIANFHGHVHCFKVGNISGTEALRVAIPNACFARTNEYGEAGNLVFGEAESYEKTDTAGNNTAFCVVSVDLDNKVIYADCFGAGYDRVISYGGEVIVTYSVTNKLSNATNSNGTASVIEGTRYTATIAAKSGYELTGITVTMGGVDITATAVSGSNITIAEVTGDIVITATTVQTETPPSYTNLVPTSIDADGSIYNGTGYQEGYRLNSSGTTTALSGAVNCGFIPYNGEVVRVYGSTAKTAGTSGHYIALYDSSFAKIHVLAGNGVSGGVSYGANGDKYMMTLDPAAAIDNTIKGYLASAAYIRCSMANCSGKNFVVTLDEPIE